MPESKMPDESFIEVFRAENVPHAHMVKDHLEAAGIPARVEGDFLQGAVGGVPAGWSSSPRVLVAESDAAAAIKTLDLLEQSRHDSP
jgi:hypothetical protein